MALGIVIGELFSYAQRHIPTVKLCLSRRATHTREKEMTIFAKIAGSRGHLFAMFMHQQAGGAWTDTPDEGFVTTDCDQPEVWAHLPELTEADARDVAEHCFYSGADLTVAARVMSELGAEALHDYCDTQNCYSMPGAPEMPEEQLKWVGSGLTPTPTIQLGA